MALVGIILSFVEELGYGKGSRRRAATRWKRHIGSIPNISVFTPTQHEAGAEVLVRLVFRRVDIALGN
jgi:hypothetical protein